MRAVFKKDRVTGFAMTKDIGKHVYKRDDTQPAAPAKKRKAPAGDAPAKKRKAPAAGGGGTAYKGSPELAAFAGVETNNRFTINKIVWTHIKQHALQKESDKRVIVCDATLKDLFGVDEFSMFHLSKLINKHFLKD